jgi:predicted lipid-binding transport protein (Tim44 family)
MKQPLFIALSASAVIIILAVVLAIHFGVFTPQVKTKPADAQPIAAAAASPTASPDQSAQDRASRYNEDMKAFTARRPQK